MYFAFFQVGKRTITIHVHCYAVSFFAKSRQQGFLNAFLKNEKLANKFCHIPLFA